MKLAMAFTSGPEGFCGEFPKRLRLFVLNCQLV